MAGKAAKKASVKNPVGQYMPLNQAIPAGVKKHEGRGVPAGSKGQYTPEAIGPGRAGTKTIGGTPPAIEFTPGSANAQAGATMHAGTEHMGGNPKTTHGGSKGPDKAGKGAGATPPGVSKYTHASPKKC